MMAAQRDRKNQGSGLERCYKLTMSKDRVYILRIDRAVNNTFFF